MAIIIDRRSSKKFQNSTNKEKFKDRHKETIKEAIKKTLSSGGIKDILDLDGFAIPISDNEPYIATDGKNMDEVFIGNKKYRKGDTLPKPPEDGGNGSKAGTGKGKDSFIYTLTKEDLDEFLYKHLELPFLVEKDFKELSETKWQNAGFKSHGIPSNLSVIRSFRNSIGRNEAMKAAIDEEIKKIKKDKNKVNEVKELEDFKTAIPFLDDIDLRYRFKEKKEVRVTRAVMICLMDVSGSMDKDRKTIAKNFFVLLALFLRYKYEKLEIVFVAHDEDAEIVSEEDFFYSTKSGGTKISSGLELVKQIIQDKYPPSQYNLYLAHASDGENIPSDEAECISIFEKSLLPMLNMYAFIGTAVTKIWQTHIRNLAPDSYVVHLNTVSEANKKVIVSFIDFKEDVFNTFVEVFKRKD